MLTKLSVTNYVLIEHLEVDFSYGFTVITGETGAGKSIILGALGLLLGERAVAASKKNADKKVTVEGVFNITGYALSSFFEQYDLDMDEDSTVLRREILPSGKSRAFINDTPVKAHVLKMLGVNLVDIHSQHENQQLLQPSYQLAFVDAYAKHQDDVNTYQEGYKAFKNDEQELSQLKEAQSEALKKADYISFQLKEMEDAQVEQIDYSALKKQFDLLENADEIAVGLQGAVYPISENENNAISLIKSALSSIISIDSLINASELTNRLSSVEIELDDIRLELEGLLASVESNPSELVRLRDQMDEVNRLLFKHQLVHFEELLSLKKNLTLELETLSSKEEEIVFLSQKVQQQEVELLQKAQELHAFRMEASMGLSKEIQSHVGELGMQNAQVQFDWSQTPQLNAYGNSELQVLFSANKGMQASPLEKTASGGERSRLMLVLKKIHAGVAQVPTLILDEIDTGISGEIAAKTATMLGQMTQQSQIISITHLPQVAAQAGSHLLVSKATEGSETRTHLRALTQQERVSEIARMLSGENISTAALENATQLMRQS